MRKQNIVQGTIFLIVVMAMIKILGLINRFFIARLLTPEGFAVYMLVMPTFLLLLSLAQFGFPISITKLVSENTVYKTTTNKTILFSALKISLFNSSVLIAALLFSARYLAHHLLHDPRTYYPLLALTNLIPLVSFSSIIKSYLHGLHIISLPAYAQLLEQIARIVFSILFVFLLRPYGISLAVAGSIAAIAIGELVAIIYLLFRLLDRQRIRYLFKPLKLSYNPTRDILRLSIPATGNRLVGTVTHFFEPIIFVKAMVSLGVGSSYTTRLYGQISGYVISTLTVPTFVVIAIATTLLPVMTEAYARGNTEQIVSHFNQSLLLSYLVGAIYLIINMVFPETVMMILFGTTEGSRFLTLLAPFFIFYYFEQPLQQTLYAINQGKFYLMTTLFCNTLKLALIYLLVSKRQLHVYGLLIAIAVNILLIVLTSYIALKRHIHLTLRWKNIISCLMIAFTTYWFGTMIRTTPLPATISLLLTVLFYIMVVLLFNVGQFRSLILKAVRYPDDQKLG